MVVGVYMKWVIRVIWGSLIALGLGTLLIYPEWFTAEHLADVLARYPAWAWTAYIGISCLRGFSLLPSTPFVLAGTLLFPDHLHWVLVASIMCILFSSLMVYVLSPVWQLDHHFKPKTLALLHDKLDKPSGFFFVFLWAFFPAVPTDAICYVAGTLRLRVLPFLAAVGLGEILLVAAYVYLGNSAFAVIKGWF